MLGHPTWGIEVLRAAEVFVAVHANFQSPNCKVSKLFLLCAFSQSSEANVKERVRENQFISLLPLYTLLTQIMSLDTWRLSQCEGDCRGQVRCSEGEVRLRLCRRFTVTLESKERGSVVNLELRLFRRLCALFSELQSIADAAEDDALFLFESKCQLLVRINVDLCEEAHLAREAVYEQSVLAVYEAWWRSRGLEERELCDRAHLDARQCCARVEPLLESFRYASTRLFHSSLIASLDSNATHHKMSLRGLFMLSGVEAHQRCDIVKHRLSFLETLRSRYDEGRRLRQLVEADRDEQRALLIDMEEEARAMVLALQTSAWHLLGESCSRSEIASIASTVWREEYQQRVLWLRQEAQARHALENHSAMLLAFQIGELEDSHRLAISAGESTSWVRMCGDALTAGGALCIYSLERDEQAGRTRIVMAEKLVLTFEAAAAADDRVQVEISDHISFEDVSRLRIEEEEDSVFVEICIAEEVSWHEAPRLSVGAAEFAGRHDFEGAVVLWMSAAMSEFLPSDETCCRLALVAQNLAEAAGLFSELVMAQEALLRETIAFEEDESWRWDVAPPVVAWCDLANLQIAEIRDRGELEDLNLTAYIQSVTPSRESCARECVICAEHDELSSLVDLFLQGLFASCIKFGAAAVHIEAHDTLLQSALAERELLYRTPIELQRATELDELLASHLQQWHLLVSFKLTFRRQESARQAIGEQELNERQHVIHTMIAAAQRYFVAQENEMMARWRAKRLCLQSDMQDTYLAMMRDTAFELFYNHAVALASQEEAEFEFMNQHITAEIEFLSQFLFYGLRLSDGRYDANSLEKSKYNCLRVVDAYPPSAPQIRPGDLIMSVNGVPSVSLKAMRKAISLLRPVATFTVARDNGQLFNVQVLGAYKAVSRAVSVTSATVEGYL